MPPRRSIRELSNRFRFEPSLNDIYVEGGFDKRILDRAFSYLQIHQPIYLIETIDVPDELVINHGMTLGNKQRVISLSRELALPVDTLVRFLVDTDMDNFLDRRMDFAGLKYTKFCDTEGAFLSEEIIRDLIVIAGRASIPDWNAMFISMEAVVKQLFALRLAFYEVIPQVELKGCVKSLSKQASSILLNEASLLARSCNFPGGHEAIVAVTSRASYWQGHISDLRAQSAGRGHDYIELISWVIRQFGGAKNVADAIENILILLVPQVADDLVEPMR